MNQNEKELFFELSKPTDSRLNEEMLMSANAEVLGHLFYNRTAGIAYNNLLKYGYADKLNREFRNALKNAYEVNIEINESYFKCVSEVSAMLLSSGIKAVMLKGAYLCFKYPEGCRTSNDIDILVHPKDIGKLDELLVKNGFRQGTVRKGEFVPASREEIITSKMTRGETVPYVKEVDLPKIKYIEVDVNFSLDFKNGDKDIVGKMLEKAVVSEAGGIKIPTLCKEDFFIHLCAHLYKEATTLPWIRMKRDMTLYKYCDICYLLSEMTDGDTYTLFERAGELNMLNICGFAIINARNLFNLPFSKAIHDFGCVIHKNMGFMGRVFSPEDNKYLRYKTASVKERFFIENRENDITEESIYDKLKNDS